MKTSHEWNYAANISEFSYLITYDQYLMCNQVSFEYFVNLDSHRVQSSRNRHVYCFEIGILKIPYTYSRSAGPYRKYVTYEH